jgi:hypothetical protein
MRRLSLALAIALTLPAMAPPPDDTKGALESDPSGWTDLLARAGKELDNWTRGPIPPTGKLNPQSQWSMEEATGYLVCEGDKGHEWLRYDKEVGDFILHVEFRYTPVTTGKKSYNSGVYARNSKDATVWHQAQIGGGSGGYLFGETLKDGKLSRFNLSKEADKRVKPAGEWNAIEITCKGKDMSLWVNGGVTCTLHDCEVARGYVGLEAEGYRIEFRNVKLKEW